MSEALLKADVVTTATRRPAPKLVAANRATADAPDTTDFYREFGVPSAQDVSDLARHFARREALYRQLGLPAALLRGRDVMEIGPGTGHNALFIDALNPSRYVLLDENADAVAETQAKVKRPQDVFQGKYQTFDPGQQFDVVLCEGVLPWRPEPFANLKSVARFVRPGGVLVTTCTDAEGYLSECIRRALATLIIHPNAKARDRVDTLTPVFAPHLATIVGMSRKASDWVLDSMVSPHEGDLLPIDEAIDCLAPDFDAYGTSPHVNVDWRWYKRVDGYNEPAKESYLASIHGMLDSRMPFSVRSTAANLAARAHCKNIITLERALWRVAAAGTDYGPLVRSLARECHALAADAATYSPQTEAALREAADLLARGAPPKAVADAKHFGPWFGHGQQYLSLIRKVSP